MTRPGTGDAIQDEANLAQRRAAHPATSIWVAASAGSGKTKVLTDRALALMLDGTPPGRLLCLTFTKAAAAEMANRLAHRLALWAAAADEDLICELRRLTGRMPGEDDLHRARRLFARVLECPGGMKIQTIHAFCQSLLRRFPLEAGIPPYFEPLDERSAAERMLAAREAVLAEARAGRAPEVAAALGAVTALVGELEFAELLQALAGERGRLAAALADGPDRLARRLRRTLGVAPGATAEGLLAAGVEDAALDLLGLRYCVGALAQGSDGERARAAAIARWLEAPERRVVGFADYCGCFHTKAGQVLARLINAATLRAAPGADTILRAEAERLLALRERWRAALLAEASQALLTVAAAMLDAYRRQKQRRAELDYDDLILLARDLLSREGVAPWVLFKLDGGLDHILIDEAQDTSPEQWEVVRRLAEEFFAGEGARARPRTLFVVGDVKQSIFSFQGADPAAFARMREHFRARALAAQQHWDDVPLTISFRSTAAVLAAIDHVFARDAARDGVALDGRPIAHRPFRVGAPGLVELWPPAVPLDEADPPAWAPPTRRVAADSPRARLARLIAQRIAAMIGRETLPSTGRPIDAGDVMVLVRRRNGFVDELIRELKQHAVPVAGIDRMVLTDQLAVMDLMAVGQFLLQPGDDLTLAALLKSPLVGLPEEALFELAHPRGDRRLWEALGERRAEPAYAEAHALLAALLGRADQVRPHELYADLLGRGGGRRRLLGRLGPDAADPIEEFLNLALQHERSHVPSLQSFLAWLAAGGVEVKRDLEQESGGQVRVLTVHGAKGLQAPIVFLPDTMAVPQLPVRLLWTKQGLPLWSPRVDHDEAVAAAARQAHKAAVAREYRRLLYVAMTRAEDRLYVAGWQGAKAPPGDCWYRLIADGLAGSGERFPFDSRPELGPRDGWQDEGVRIAPHAAPPVAPGVAPPAPAGPAIRPGWLSRPPPPEPTPPRPLVPSRPAAPEPAVRPPLAGDRGARFQRGRLVHRLLELLPALPAAERAGACRRWLAQPGHDLAPAEQEALAAEILRLLADPACAALFGPDARAEVPVIGRLADPAGRALVLSGRIDRLLVEPERVLIVDYKTNRPPPRRAADVPPVYLQQMAAYRAALARIYPGRRIDCALLWTDGPDLMALPAALLDGRATAA